MVGERGHDHHEHRRRVEEDDHDPAQRPPGARRSEKPDPEERVSQAKE
jgi:hypothetical protein